MNNLLKMYAPNLIRKALMYGAGYLTAHYAVTFDASTLDAASALLLGLVSTSWSFAEKSTLVNRANIALGIPAGTAPGNAPLGSSKR